MTPYYQDDAVTILNGDCREAMKTLAGCSVDSVVTDPPYELGFMGKGWDRSGIAYDVNVWRECLRVLKPGGHLLAFGGSRTYHRLACAIEDAGFEIRDQIQWLYGSGFPKSLDVSKAIDAAAGAEREVAGRKQFADGTFARATQNLGTGVFNDPQSRESNLVVTTPATEAAKQWSGWGTALKPAHEPIVLARKPLIGTVAENVLKHGTGGLNIDGCRVEAETATGRHGNPSYGFSGGLNNSEPDGRPVQGRWPANVITDGSEEVLAGFPAEAGGGNGDTRLTFGIGGNEAYHGGGKGALVASYADSGSAARFFYTAKASKQDREEGLSGLPLFSPGELTNRQEGSAGLQSPRAGAGRAKSGGGRNNHPTVKPLALMRYLVRLVTPPGGLAMDPFCGSGSTGKACALEGFKAILIDVDAGYCELATKRCQVDYQSGLFTVTEPTPFNQPEIDDTPTQEGLFAITSIGD